MTHMHSLDLPTPYVVGYTRVSSKEQTQGYSLGNQEADIRTFCERESLDLLAIYSDPGRSGGSLNQRMGLLEMLSLVEQGGIGAVIVWREDRLARKVSLARDISAKVHSAGAEILTLNPFFRDRGPAHGQESAATLRQLQQIMAESELATLRSRIIPGLLSAARSGVRGGHTPLGYLRLPDGGYIVDEDLAAVVTRCFTVAAGGMAITTLVKQLAAEGHRRPDGKPITYEQIQHLLSNPFYRGELIYVPKKMAAGDRSLSRVVLPNHHPALVDALTFAQVQSRLQRTRKAGTRSAAAGQPVHLSAPSSAAAQSSQPSATLPTQMPAWSDLTANAIDRVRERQTGSGRPVHGIAPPQTAMCGRCGGPLYCVLQTRGSRGDRYRVPVYQCETHKRLGNAVCDQPPAPGAEIDEVVAAALHKAIQHDGYFRSWEPPALPPALGDLEHELSAVTQRIERLAPLAETTPRLKVRLESLQTQHAALTIQRQRLRTQRRVPTGPRWDCLRDFAATWPALTIKQQRDVVGWLTEQVIIDDRKVKTILFRSAPSQINQTGSAQKIAPEQTSLDSEADGVQQ